MPEEACASKSEQCALCKKRDKEASNLAAKVSMEGYSRSLHFNSSPILNILNRKNVKLSNNTLAYAVKSPGDYEVKIFVTHDNINKVYIQKKDYDYTPGHVNQNTKFNLTPLQGKQDFPNFISEFHNDKLKMLNLTRISQ